MANYIENHVKNYDKWSTCQFPVPRYYRVASQFAESLNAAILPLRGKGMLELVSGLLHWWCMKFQERRQLAAQYDQQFRPKTNAVLAKSRERGEGLEVNRVDTTTFFVKDGETVKKVVLNEKPSDGGFILLVAECSCPLANESGIICAHIAAVCKENTQRQMASAISMSRYLLTVTKRATFSESNTPVPVPFSPANLAVDRTILAPLDVKEDKRRKRLTAKFERVKSDHTTRPLRTAGNTTEDAETDRL